MRNAESPVAGVDGCPAGWVVVLIPPQTQEPEIRLCPHFCDILALRPKPDIIAIDIPIGLLDEKQGGGRECDRWARKKLGPPRQSSVFSPPIRRDLEATAFEQVQGLSKQAFALVPKIREVDQSMTTGLQRCVHETHPELAFRSLVGTPMQYNKKKHAGRKERLGALEQLAPFQAVRDMLARVERDYLLKHIARDDFLDACVLAWLAGRIAASAAQRLPAEPPLDAKGLRMEIWY